MNKKLTHKNIHASIAIGDDLIVPYNQSEVFADFNEDSEEIYVLVNNKQDPTKSVKLFFKKKDLDHIIKDEK